MLLLLNLSRKRAETTESRDPGSCQIKAEGPSGMVLPGALHAGWAPGWDWMVMIREAKGTQMVGSGRPPLATSSPSAQLAFWDHILIKQWNFYFFFS